MKTCWIEKEFAYDGSQLKSLFTYLNFKVQGDSISAWIGACDIPDEHMLDGEDLVAGEEIRGGKMLHFIVEKFGQNLFSGVALQRLLASIAKDLLEELTKTKIKREGDDLYWNDGKMSISIATQSPVSTLIHFAVNINNENTPVKTAALDDLGLEPIPFAKELMNRFSQETASIQVATEKVRPVL